MTAASLLVGFVASSLLNQAQHVRDARRRRIEDFRSCHAELKPLQEYFWALDIDLMNRHPVDTQAHIPLHDLMSSTEFWQGEAPNLVVFRRSVATIGQEYFANQSGVVGRPLLSWRTIAVITDAFERLDGIFGREKHFGPVLEQLGITRGTPLETARVTTWAAVAHKAKALLPHSENKWWSLAFLEDMSAYGHDLTQRMRRMAFELEQHRPEGLRDLLALGAWVLLGCVALPCAIQLIPEGFVIRQRLLGAAAALLLGGLCAGWVLVRRWIAMGRADEEGMLEV